MNYKECLEYMFSDLSNYYNKTGVILEYNLENTKSMDIAFSKPHESYKTIHIAGTNGKGSTSNLLAAILQKSGYNVGLYTSPHLVDFKERILVNGKKISKEYVVGFIEKIKAMKNISPSFFEITMMMAFCYFRDEKIDVAVIETGVGGLLDSTNIISPDLSVITNISLDHVHLLGENEEKIAVQKSGIMKDNTPVIIGEANKKLQDIFKKEARKKENVVIVFAQDEKNIISGIIEKGKWHFDSNEYPNLIGGLSGYAQIKNANTVLSAVKKLKKLGYNISSEAVYDAFENVCNITGFLGRWQKMNKNNINMILDIGHNVGGIEYVSSQLKNETYNNLHIVFGMVKGKDIASILSIMPKDAKYYFTKANISRALDENILCNEAKEHGLLGVAFNNVEEAILSAMKNYTKGDLIFIGGSNFIVADGLEFLER